MLSARDAVTATRQAGDEPIPGYVLVEPLGRGGFGEVWKCVAPGGLHKAVKFVPAGGDQYRQEAAAFERVRAVRHAFLLSLERVEPVGGDLVMVMELADAQLQDRFDECRRGDLRGIPRDELLRYLADAAEFVDALVAAARAGEGPPAAAEAETRSDRFLCTIPAAQVSLKLAEVARRFGLSMEVPEPGEVVLRRRVSGPPGSGVFRPTASELWVCVRRTQSGPETTATAGLGGDPGDPARRDALRAVPGVLAAVRGALETMRERRAHPRYPAGFPVRLHPVGPDGSVEAAEDGVCEDVSAGGARILTPAALPGGRVYLEFRTVEGLAGSALLADVVRSAPGPGGHLTACRFRR